MGIRRLRPLRQWAWRGRRIWGPVVLALIGTVAIMVMLPKPLEARLRLSGFLLQVAGLCTVAYNLNSRSRYDRRPGLLADAWSWFRHLPRIISRKPRHISYTMGTTISIRQQSTSVHVSGPKRSPDAPIEKQLDALWANVEVIQANERSSTEALQRELSKLNDRIDEESKNRTKAFMELESRAVETLHIEKWGLVYLIIGLGLATCAPELSEVFTFHS